MQLSLTSMQTSFVWLLCSLSLIASTRAAKKCAGGVPLQLASNFKGYKPASSYCASNYPITAVTVNKNFPATIVTSFSVVSTVTVYNATTTVTVTADPGIVITTTTTTTALNTPSVALAGRNYIVKGRDHVIKERDYVQDQVFSSLQQQPSMLSSVCECLSATATVTKSITDTRTLTVPTTATTYAVQTQTVTVPSTLCLTDDTANNLINGFAFLLTNYNDNTAEALLADNFTDTSDSINQIAGYGDGTVTFPSKAAFKAGQGSQPAIGFTVISVDTITCNTLSFRWQATLYPGATGVKGINVMVASNLNNTAEGWQIETNYSEFNSLLWFGEIGGTCSYGAPPPP